jgi:2-keto-4-pentenoate hydratase/2-oxohepta-3-ene-1,7-dioic acid hydratase in catechol pathway
VLPRDEWLTSREYVEREGTLTVRINGRVVASGELSPMAGGFGSSLEWLRGHLAEFGTDLLPGHVVLTGTPLGLYPVRRGDRVAVFVDHKIGAMCTVV